MDGAVNSSASRLLDYWKGNNRNKVNTPARYQTTKKQKIIYVHVSKPVWQVDGSCKAVVALDFTAMTRGKPNTQFFLRADVMKTKFFVDLATPGDDVEGKYVSAILENVVNLYDRRAHPGDQENEPLFTDKNNQFNYRFLAGVLTFHGIDKENKEAFASELDILKEDVESITKNDDTFVQDYVFAAYYHYCHRGQDFREFADMLVQYDGDVGKMYQNEVGTRSAMFSRIFDAGKNQKSELYDIHTQPIVINQDIALDEIFLDSNAVDLGKELYGLYSEEYQDILMKNAGTKPRSFIPKFMKKKKN